jgi:hypothetical protein
LVVEAGTDNVILAETREEREKRERRERRRKKGGNYTMGEYSESCCCPNYILGKKNESRWCRYSLRILL